MALAFHKTHCAHYKLVCIRALKPVEDLFQIQVYSSDTITWKICIESFSAQKLDFRYPVYWNGAVHWVPYYQTRSSFMYFKFDIEQLQILPVQKGLGSDEILMYLGESRGCLHLISRTDREEDILRLNVYEMLRDQSEWVVKYRLQLVELLGDFPEVIRQYQTLDDFRNIYFGNKCVFRVVDVVRGKAEEDTFLVLLTPRKLLRYNVHDKSCKELYSNKDYSCEFTCEFTSVHRYIETLSSF
ncbi:F-box protein At5g07610-like [Bidens hawaiensis]|uniref:F-box protein At5g07610-like n=1 Tax=Bidens hawaiensis TaxID=980011 RepID=UPI00404AF41D